MSEYRKGGTHIFAEIADGTCTFAVRTHLCALVVRINICQEIAVAIQEASASTKKWSGPGFTSEITKGVLVGFFAFVHRIIEQGLRRQQSCNGGNRPKTLEYGTENEHLQPTYIRIEFVPIKTTKQPFRGVHRQATSTGESS